MLAKKRLTAVLVSMCVGAIGAAIPSGVAVAATTWNNGDVFAGVGSGSYNVYDNTGVFKQTISDGRGGFTTGCAFNALGSKLYTTNFTSNLVEVYDNNDPHAILQTIDTTGSGAGDNESVVFAADGSFYVGHPDGNHALTHYDASGTFLKEYFPAVERRGTDWVDLSADQKTMFYTSEGQHVKRFDVSTSTQLTDFNGTALPGGAAFALRLLPPGNGSGGLLVADTSAIKRLDAAGNVTQTYAVAGENGWFSLNLDPNGTSFWSGSFDTGHFFRFNIATGAQEVGPISTTSQLFGLCLKGEPTAAIGNITLTPATATNPTGTNHTVTATVTTNGVPTPGVLVSFSITAGPDAGAPGTCSSDPTCHTDVNGHVSFTYTNNGSPGTDVIRACFIDSTGAKQCTAATKTWIVVEQKITATGTNVSATEGSAFVNQPVATIFDPDKMSTAAEYTASIDWGDASSSPGTVTGPLGGPFVVSGSHTYAEEGNYTITVVITDVDNSSNGAKTSSTASVVDAPLKSACAMPPVSAQTYSGPTAGFSDANSGPHPEDFPSANLTINWGDSTTSQGTLGGVNPYTVSGTHTYTSTGNFTVTTTIVDVGGSKTVATCTVLVAGFPTANGGTFVVGDLEAGLGNSVTWWSSQWAQINLMSGGPAPSSMKGFAGFEDMPLPSPLPALDKLCGMTWTTDTGNATPPPQTVPDDMFVIVSSHIVQNGSVISGDIKELIVVKNNPGYQPAPGHQGTGTEEAIVCAI